MLKAVTSWGLTRSRMMQQQGEGRKGQEGSQQIVRLVGARPVAHPRCRWGHQVLRPIALLGIGSWCDQ